MHKRTIKFLAFASFALAGLQAPNVYAEDALDIDIEAIESSIESDQSKVTTIDEEIETILSEVSNAANQLEQIESNIVLNKQALAQEEDNMTSAELAISELSKEISELTRLIDQRNDRLKEQARTLQQDGQPLEYIEFLLDSSSLTDAIQRVSTVSKMVGANRQIVQDQLNDRATVEEKYDIMLENIESKREAIIALEGINESLTQQQLEREYLTAALALEKSDAEDNKVELLEGIKEAESKVEAYEIALEEKHQAEEEARLAAEAKAQAEALAKVQAEEEAARQLAKALEQAEREKAAVAQRAEVKVASVVSPSTPSTPAAEAPQAEVAQAPQAPQAAVESVPVQAAPSTSLGWPATSSTITSHFGWRANPLWGGSEHHRGLDIGGGGSILAAESGTVTTAGYHYSYGNYVVINHNNGLKTLYAHMAHGSLAVYTGQSVSRGQMLGTMGTTGSSTGVHLHFEVLQGGTPVNPLGFL